MTDRSNEMKELHEELKWVTLRETNSNFTGKLKSKGISGILVPIGCAATVGVLISGIYFMFKRNSRKQQSLMRYRVLAQGITIGIAMIGTLSLKTT